MLPATRSAENDVFGDAVGPKTQHIARLKWSSCLETT